MISDKTFVVGILTVLLITAIAILTAQPPPTEQPEQLPYVVFFTVCGEMQGAVLTTNPPQWIDDNTGLIPEVLAQMNEAEENDRSYVFNGLDKDNCEPVVH